MVGKRGVLLGLVGGFILSLSGVSWAISPPQSVTVDSEPGGAINITWNTVPSAIGYKIYRKSAMPGNPPIGTETNTSLIGGLLLQDSSSQGTTTSFTNTLSDTGKMGDGATDKKTTNGTHYYYLVSAVDSGLSESATATPSSGVWALSSLPNQVSLGANPLPKTTTVQLTWSNPGHSVGDLQGTEEISHYEIYRKFGFADISITDINAAIATTATVTSITDDYKIAVANTPIKAASGVTGVWLTPTPSAEDINYYKEAGKWGGSYNPLTGSIYLGKNLPGGTSQVYAAYYYVELGTASAGINDRGASPATEYSYGVMAVDIAGNRQSGIATGAKAKAITAITNLLVENSTAPGTSTINLRWAENGSPGTFSINYTSLGSAYAINIYRKTGVLFLSDSDLINANIIATFTTPLSTYTDYTVKMGTNAAYAVILVDQSAKKSALSNDAGTYTVDRAAPKSAFMTGPNTGAIYSGTINVTAAAQDNPNGSGIDKMVFYWLPNGGGTVTIGTATVNTKGSETTLWQEVGTYTFAWNSTTVSNGTGNLYAVAYDMEGNTLQTTNAPPWTITIDNTRPVIGTLSVSQKYAKTGATVTISFEVNEQLSSAPIVTVNGNNATYISGLPGPGIFGFTYVIAGSEGEGTATMAISASDMATPPNVGTFSDASQLFVDHTAPNAPSGLSATAIPNGSITLAWTDNGDPGTASGVSFCNIYRNEMGTPTTLLVSGVVTTTYIDTTGTDGTTCYYRLTSVDKAGNESAYSSQSQAASDATGPSFSNFVATPNILGLGTTTITFKESEPLQATPTVTVRGISAVYVSCNSGTWTFTYTENFADLAYATVTIRVFGTDTVGNSGSTVNTQALVIDTTRPTIGPIGVNPSSAGSGTTINITFWVNEALIVNPDVKVGTRNAAYQSGANTAAATYTYTYIVTGLDPQGIATITVVAVDLAAPANQNTNGTTFSIDSIAPNTPATLTATAVANGAIVLSWTDPGDPAPSSGMKQFNIYCNETGTPTTLLTSVSGTTTYRDTSGTDGVTYHYRVTAEDNAGNKSGYSNEANATSDATLPTFANFTAAPHILGLGVGTITFKESESLQATSTVTVRGISAVYVSYNSGTWTFTYTEGTPNLAYATATILIAGIDVAGNSGSSTNEGALIIDTTQPGIGTVTATPSPAGLGTLVTITFNVDEALASPPVVTINAGEGTATYVSGTITEGSSYKYTYPITGSESQGTANILVSATDLASPANVGTAATSIFIDSILPNTPATLTATAVANGAIVLSWTDPGDPAPSSGMKQFNIYRNETGTPTTLLTSVSGTTTYRDTSGTDGVTYHYRVTAEDNAGNKSGYSNEANATSDATLPTFANFTAAPHILGLGAGTITFKESESLQATPTVTVRGISAVYVSYNSGTWTFTYTEGTANLAYATATILIAGIDVAGNSGSSTNEGALIIDTTQPGIGTVTATPSPVGLGTLVTITFNVDEALASPPVVTINAGEGTATYVSGTITEGSSYKYTYTIAGSESQGTAAILVSATDLAGPANVRTAGTSIFIDSVASGTPTIGATATANATIAIAWSAFNDPAPSSGLKIYRVYRSANGGATYNELLATSTITSYQDSGTHGTIYHYIVTTGDNAGNVSATSTAAQVTADAVGPSFGTFTAPSFKIGLGGPGTITFQATEALSGSPTVNISGGGQANYISYAAGIWTYLYNPSASDPQGTVPILVVGTDTAGNQGTGSNNTTLIIDTESAVITNVTANPPGAGSGTVVAITFNASEGVSANPTVTVNGEAATYISGSATTGGLFEYSYTVPGGGTGAATIVIITDDLAVPTNHGIHTNVGALWIDADPPRIGYVKLSPATSGQSALKDRDTVAVVGTVTGTGSPLPTGNVSGEAVWLKGATVIATQSITSLKLSRNLSSADEYEYYITGSYSISAYGTANITRVTVRVWDPMNQFDTKNSNSLDIDNIIPTNLGFGSGTTFIYPQAGPMTLSGTITLKVMDVRDNTGGTGIWKIEYYYKQFPVGQSPTPPYSYPLPAGWIKIGETSNDLGGGSYTLTFDTSRLYGANFWIKAVAFDKAGNPLDPPAGPFDISDLIAPTSITNITAQAIAGSPIIKLDWSADTSAYDNIRIGTYTIYRQLSREAYNTGLDGLGGYDTISPEQILEQVVLHAGDTKVVVSGKPIVGVDGVWSDAAGGGLNYYAGGNYNKDDINLGTPIPANGQYWIQYYHGKTVYEDPMPGPIGVDLFYIVRLTDGAGNKSSGKSGEFTITEAVKKNDFTPPESITDLQAAAGGTNTSVDLKWTPPSDNVEVKGYRIYRKEQIVGVGSDTSNFEFTKADVNKANLITTLPNSSLKSHNQMLQTTVPSSSPWGGLSGYKTTLKYSLESNTMSVFDWTTKANIPSGESGANPYWRLTFDRKDIWLFNVNSGDEVVNHYASKFEAATYNDAEVEVLSNLTKIKVYAYFIVPVDTSNNANDEILAGKSTVRVVAVDTTPPTKVTTLKATALKGSIAVALNWDGAEDNVAVSYYNLYREESPIISLSGLSPLATTSGTNYNDMTGTQGTTYSYAITAVDAGEDRTPGNTDDNEGILGNSSSATINDISNPTATFTITPNPVNQNQVVRFNAGGSWDNVGINSYEWDFGDGSGVSGVVSPTHQYTKAGVATVTLTIKDAAGHSAVLSQGITVNDIGAPTAVITGGNKVVNEDTAVAFDGSESTDSDGTVVTYIWNFGAATANPPSASTSSATLNVTYTQPGIYTASLKVVDNSGNTSTTSFVQVTVKDVTPPTANAGSDQTVKQMDLVRFNAGGSADNVGIISYTWNFGDGAPATVVTPDGADHKYAGAGVYVVTLVTKDAAGNSGTDTMTVTVNDITVPIARIAGGDKVVNEDTAVAFDGSESTDSDGTVVTYIWNFGAATANPPSASTSSATLNVTYTQPGIYTASLKVVDNSGNTSTTSFVQVTVKDVTPPTANAGSDQTVKQMDLVRFNAGGSADNVGIISYTWNFGDGAPATVVTPDGANHRYAGAGVYVVTLVTKDAAGNSGTDTMTVTVNDITVPIARIAGGDKVVNEDTPVTFDGSESTDSDGTVVTYIWNFGAATANPPSASTSSSTLNVTYGQPGIYTASLKVVDNSGNTSTTSFVQVTVKDVTPPTANAGSDQTVKQMDLVRFNAGGSADNVGIISYTWNFGDGAPATVVTPDGANHKYAGAGVYVVTLVTKDAAGNSGTDTMTVTVNDITVPIARIAGGDKVVNEDTPVTFDGSESTDSGGTVVTYIWDFGAATANPPSASTSSATLNVTYTQPGIYTASLKVVDNSGNTSTVSSFIQVTVKDVTNPSLVMTGTPTASTTGESVIVSAIIGDNVKVTSALLYFAPAGGVSNQTSPVDISSGNVSLTIAAGFAGNITYQVVLRDAAGNETKGNFYTLAATDDDKPAIKLNDSNPTQVKTTDPLEISAVITDNIGVTNVVLTYRYKAKDGSIQTKTVDVEKTNKWYVAAIAIPEDMILNTQLWYQIAASDGKGTTTTGWKGIEVKGKVEQKVILSNLILSHNPFSPPDEIAKFRGDLGGPSYVTIKIYDTAGQEVRTVVENQLVYPTSERVLGQWDGRTNGGELADNGIYIYQIKIEQIGGGTKVETHAIGVVK